MTATKPKQSRNKTKPVAPPPEPVAPPPEPVAETLKPRTIQVNTGRPIKSIFETENKTGRAWNPWTEKY